MIIMVTFGQIFLNKTQTLVISLFRNYNEHFIDPLITSSHFTYVPLCLSQCQDHQEHCLHQSGADG